MRIRTQMRSVVEKNSTRGFDQVWWFCGYEPFKLGTKLSLSLLVDSRPVVSQATHYERAAVLTLCVTLFMLIRCVCLCGWVNDTAQ